MPTREWGQALNQYGKGVSDFLKRHRILFVITYFIFSCSSITMDTPIQNTPTQSGVIGSIDLPSPFFWMLRSWKEDSLVTIDGNARFAEMSFQGRSRVRIKPLVNYPRMALDGMLITYPEYGLIISKSARRFHIADIVAKRTKSFVPYLTWMHEEHDPILIDGNEGVVIFPYNGIVYGIKSSEDTNFFVVYNYKTDITTGILGETKEDRRLVYPLDSERFIGMTYRDSLPPEVYVYNWRTEGMMENELTRVMTKLDVTGLILEHLINADFKKRYFIVNIPPIPPRKSSKAKITWEEGFKDVKVILLDYLIPVDRWFNNFFISPDGEWATCFIGGYRGLFNDLLDKRVFFHLDRRYPNGISIPIFADGYYEHHWEQGAFVRHPVYGMCFAEENIKKDDNGVERRYLRLYKMDDVLAEINRQLLEKEKEALH